MGFDLNLKNHIFTMLTNVIPNSSSLNIENMTHHTIENSNIFSHIYFIDISFTDLKTTEIVNQELVIKIARDNNPFFIKLWEHEVLMLGTWYDSDIPVPKVLAFDSTYSEGPVIIMEKITGVSLTDSITQNRSDTNIVKNLMSKYAELMVLVHNYDWKSKFNDPFGSDHEIFTKEGDNSLKIFVSSFRERSKKLGLSLITKVIDWLVTKTQDLENKQLLGLVHSDMNTDNIIVSPSGELYLIDWNWTRIVDIRIDIMWSEGFTVKIFNEELGDLLLELYLKKSPIPISDLDFFKMLNIVRFLVNTVNHMKEQKNTDKADTFVRTIDWNMYEKRIKNITGIESTNLRSEIEECLNS
ncbi:MAG: phosphotransferase [Candidatus Heimdallarchaeota archaeon]|nr:phosphotransferase [Candidatus Heimdallarchaeota archaeon]MDH5646545.1 phosphotransferase [Candidatus Heimdallarchaeota archaeon]